MARASKTPVIDDLVSQHQLSRAEAERQFDRVMNSTEAALVGGHRVKTPFGNLERKLRAGRIGRNPQTGEPIDIPAKEITKLG